MSEESLAQPYTIATLPKPLDADHGRISAAPVHSLTGPRKRKRHEVAVGVDGETVNIYNVQQQSTVSSIPLPPRSYLAAPPCSIFCKRRKPLSPQRRTYLAICDTVKEPRPRLVSYTEELGKQQDLRASTKRERKLRQGNLAGLDVIVGPPNDGDIDGVPGVLVYYKDGKVDYVPGDLSGTIWEHTPTEADLAVVEYSTTVDFQTARKGLLSGREDIVALLDPTSDENPASAPLLLCQLVRLGARRRLRLFALRHIGAPALRGSQAPLQEVLSYDLPMGTSKRADKAEYELHPASGALYQCLGHRLMIFDLSSTLPKIIFELGQKNAVRVHAFARLSTASVAAVSSGKFAIYETKYGSVLSSSSVSPTSTPDLATSEQAPNLPPIELVAQFSDLGLLVARRGVELLGLPFGKATSKGKGSGRAPALLENVLRKGQIKGDVPNHEIPGKKSMKLQKWDDWKAQVDRLVQSDDQMGLEQLVARDLHLSDDQRSGLSLAELAIKGHPESELRIWDLTANTYDPRRLDEKKALYLLGKVFAWRSNARSAIMGQYQLDVTVVSQNILRWLALAGYITPTAFQQAVALPTESLTGCPMPRPGDIMKAIQAVDSGFVLTCELLSLPIAWEITEVMQGLKLLIESLNSNTSTESQLASPAPPQNGDDIVMTDDDEESQFEAEAAAATKELEYANSVFTNGLAARSETLRLLLARLETFTNADIVNTMRSMLSTEDITFLIAILRIELRDGGWTSRHVKEGLDDDTEMENASGLRHAKQLSSSDPALRAITHLLNCCVDAVGISGWLVGRSGDSYGTEALIEAVRAEISAALEGCFEAETIGNCLDELIRLAGSEEISSMKHRADDTLTPEQTVMPLGARPGPPEVKTLYTKDRVKSRTELAADKNRAVGRYTFEQIRF